MKKIFVCGDRTAMRNYAEAIDISGGNAVFSYQLEYAKSCDALLLPGGGDVDPARYHEENQKSANIDPERDKNELELIQEFSARHKPILGICRGIQILNVAFGGTLIQDVENTHIHKWEEATGDKIHKVLAEEDGFLYPMYGGEFFVNSAHHQAIGKLAPGLRVAARSEDGLIEAVENRERMIYGVQWHPERISFHHLRPDAVDGRHIFDFFLKLFS